MGGESSSQNTQASTTNPWEAAQGQLKGILSQLTGNLGNTGVTGAENNAFGTQQSNAANYGSTYAPQIGQYAGELLSGGGATNQAGNVNANYQRYTDQTNPMAFICSPGQKVAGVTATTATLSVSELSS